MPPILEQDTPRHLGFVEGGDKLAFAKIRTEDPNSEPPVKEQIVFLLDRARKTDSSLRLEAEYVSPEGAIVYRDAGILNLSKQTITVSGEPSQVMDVPVPSDTSPKTLPQERKGTIALLQDITGPKMIVKGA